MVTAVAQRVHNGQPTDVRANPTLQNQDWKIIELASKVLSACVYGVVYPFRKLLSKLVLPASSWTLFSAADIRQLHETLTSNLNDLSGPLKGSCKEIDIGSGKSLRGFTIQHEKPKNSLIYFCENVICAETSFDLCKTLAEQGGLSVFCFSYPGTGLSDGEILSEKDLFDYARTCIDHVRAQMNPSKRLILWGHSLGGALATIIGHEYAHQGHDIAIVNERSFLSFPKLVYNMYGPVVRFVLAIAARLFEWNLDTREAATEIRTKMAVITAPNDQLIEHDNQFCHALPTFVPKNLFLMDYFGDHFNPIGDKAVKRILNFVQL